MAGSMEFTPTVADQVAANRAFMRRYFAGGAMGWLMVLAPGLFAICVVVALLTGDWESVETPLFCSAVIVAVMALNWVLLPHRVQRMLKQRPSITTLTRYVWDDRGLEVISDAGMSRVRWNELFRWWQHRQGIVFQLSDNMLLILPQRALDESQIEDLRATLLAHGPARR